MKNIDRLATMGVLFTNAHAQCAICNPSRTSIMTGLYPETTGIYFNAGDIADSPVAATQTLLTKRFVFLIIRNIQSSGAIPPGIRHILKQKH